MPELPEVETIRRELARLVVGTTFARVEVRLPKMVNLPPETFARRLRGVTVQAVKRRAKMLVLELTGGHFLVFHLKMTGQLVYAPPTGPTVSGGHPIKNLGVLPNKLTHVIFRFRRGGTLYFNDQRKFGWVKLEDADGLHQIVATLGLEPLSPAFVWDSFRRVLRRYSERPVKSALLDAHLIVGVGNIYADESLFCAGIRPRRRIKTLRNDQFRRLYHCIPRVLRLAIAKKGTTSDSYRRPDGRRGRMLDYLKVYGRAGLPCQRCGTPIAKTTVGQRGTHYCRQCQR